MNTCPHCQKKTIGALAKFWSDKACPVRCSACGGLAYIPEKETRLLNAIGFPGVILFMVMVALFNSLIPIALWVCALMAAFFSVLVKSPVVGISEAQAKVNKRYGNILLVLVVIVFALHWFFSQSQI